MIHQTLSGPLVKAAGVPSDQDVRLINSLGNPPPVPVSERDVYVRRCRLAGDAVDAYHGCFHTDDLPKLLSMIQGAPLLVGHDKRSLGVARFFGGEIEQHGEHNYVMPHFYWLRGHSSAEDLRVAIDGGLYCEASISFCYEMPTCSVCGKDIRTCEHLPGSLEAGKQVFYYYDRVVAVLEGSLVYRGAEPGTGFSLQRGTTVAGVASQNPGGGMDDTDQRFGIPTLRVKRHGKWYQAPLIEEG
ncbi:MAG: hypothetical protein NTW14_12565 [bacterium]|nr:hypothetical protein [bacterium]